MENHLSITSLRILDNTIKCTCIYESMCHRGKYNLSKSERAAQSNDGIWYISGDESIGMMVYWL